MKVLFLLNLLVFILVLFSCQSEKEKTTENKVETADSVRSNYVVIGYVAGWKIKDFSKIDVTKLTHINYAFANVIDGKVTFGTNEDTIDNSTLNENDLINLKKLKSVNADLKILVSVGGWTWSSNFSDVALTDSSRRVFAGSAADFVQKYGLDGIDIDWEYPNQIGAGNIYRPEDKENFTLLLKEIRNSLNEIESDNNHLLLTIATGGDSAYITNTNLGEASKYLDFVNVMSYDFYNGLHDITGHHSNLFPVKNDVAISKKKEDIRSVSIAVKRHLDAGVPKEKLVVGLPFYGRKWDKLEPCNTNGLFTLAETTGVIISYNEIKESYLNNPDFEHFFDSEAFAPYLYSEKYGEFISYEDSVSISKKLDFVKDNKLKGVMFWEYSDDNSGMFLDVISKKLLNVN